MSANPNGGHGSGEQHRTALLTLLEVHTEGATATELASYVDRTRATTRHNLLILEKEGRVTMSEDKLWKLTPVEATYRSALTPAPRQPFPLSPIRTAGRSR
jgi:hypothetical protein